MTKDNIVLVGFMGAGKTTVGKILANALQYDFIDTDEQIVIVEKMTIPNIFEKKGENYFRKAESKVLHAMIKKQGQVISTGGGIVTIQENIPMLRQGIVIYLKATPKHIYKNVKKDTSRPLLQKPDVYSTICNMLEEREEFYKKASQYVISVDGKTPQEICIEILEWIKE